MEGPESDPHPNPIGQIEGMLEEMLAEQKREAFVREFHQHINEQLIEEREIERRRNAEAAKRLAKRMQEVQHETEHDPMLTELLNRKGFERIVEEARKEGITGALLMADIDKFKDINDTYGHLIGDLMLRTVARRFKSICRESDQIARWGGEEFLMFFPNATAEDILKKFTPEGTDEAKLGFVFEKQDSGAPVLNVTFSGGITNLGPHEIINDAVARADAALYHVKKNGRNRLEIAAPDADTLSRVRP